MRNIRNVQRFPPRCDFLREVKAQTPVRRTASITLRGLGVLPSIEITRTYRAVNRGSSTHAPPSMGSSAGGGHSESWLKSVGWFTRISITMFDHQRHSIFHLHSPLMLSLRRYPTIRGVLLPSLIDR